MAFIPSGPGKISAVILFALSLSLCILGAAFTLFPGFFPALRESLFISRKNGLQNFWEKNRPLLAWRNPLVGGVTKYEPTGTGAGGKEREPAKLSVNPKPSPKTGVGEKKRTK